MRVNEWKKDTRSISLQDVRPTTYSVAQLGSERLFQIQTYSRSGNVCQTIQFDRDRAAELVDILKREFHLD